MSDLSNQTDILKKKYREIFQKTCEAFSSQIEKISPKDLYKFLNEEIPKDIYEKHLKILNYRDSFSCSGCGSCCKLACSEFSPEELKQKSQNGDNFATQFISVFVPYLSEEEAKKIYPEYFELLKIKAENEKVYFYHCPKVTEDNRCPDYENRPQICRDFPDNPIGFLPKTCGFTKWKEEVETTALMLHSLVEIAQFYKEKLKN